MRAFKRYSRHMRSIGVLWVTGRTVGLFLLTSLVISVMSSTLPSLEQNIVLSQNFEQTTGRSAELEVEGTPWPIAKVRSTSYNRYKKSFVLLCNEIKADGRQKKLFELLQLLKLARADCEACKPLFKTMAAACRPKREKRPPKKERKSKKDDEGADDAEETPSPSPQPTMQHGERLPHTAVIARVLNIFSPLAKGDLAVPTMDALKVFREHMREPTGKTAAEREYFATLALYAYSPFEVLDIEVSAYREEQKRIKSFDTDMLFEP